MSDENQNHPGQIDTAGGARVVGNVETNDGNFIGRDSIVHGDEIRGNKVVAGVINIYLPSLENPNKGLAPKNDSPQAIPQPFEPDTILIPAGPFVMGLAFSSNELAIDIPQHTVELSAYCIGRYPVTNQEYVEFIRCNPQQNPPTEGWFLREPLAAKLDHPVTGVSWHDAVAYCLWLSVQTRRIYRLPTEAEWEKAARGLDGRLFPWGNEWDVTLYTVVGNDTTPVTAHPAGASPYSCEDMLGNVQEWVSTLWGSERQTCMWRYPYRIGDGREAQDADKRLSRVYRLHRGGSYLDKTDNVRCTTRSTSLADSRVKWRGFRVVMEV